MYIYYRPDSHINEVQIRPVSGVENEVYDLLTGILYPLSLSVFALQVEVHQVKSALIWKTDSGLASGSLSHHQRFAHVEVIDIETH
jgi:hypothetical protein